MPSPKDLSLEEFKYIVSRFPDSGHFILHGIGESLLNPEIFEMIRYVRSLKKTAVFTTNGTLLSEDNSKKILESGLNRMGISIDGAKKETFEKIRRGADFDQVIRDTKRLVKMNENSPKPMQIWCKTTILPDNLEEIPDFAEFLKELGIKVIFLTAASTPMRDRTKLEPDPERTRQALAELRRRAKGSGLVIATPHLLVPEKAPCLWPWYGVNIAADGSVTPCCFMPNPKLAYYLGNVFRDDADEIWNGRRSREFRAMMKSTLPELCCLFECPLFKIWKELKP